MKRLPALGIRGKLLSGVIFFVLLVLLVMLGLNHFLYTTGIYDIEESSAIINIQRVEGLIKDQISNYLIKVYDWSEWDDSYQFIQDKNQNYIDSNLQNTSLVNIKINYMVFISKDGKSIIYSKGVDLSSEESINLPDNLLQIILPRIKKIGLNPDLSEADIVSTSKGPLMFAMRPITHSDGSGPIAGYLFFGRYLDNDLTKYLAELNQSELTVTNFEDPNLSSEDKNIVKLIDSEGKRVKDYDKDQESYYVKDLSPKKIVAYTIYYNLVKEPVLIIKNLDKRPFIDLGNKVILETTIVSIIITIISLVFAVITLNLTVISKITKLNKDVNLVKESKNTVNKLSVAGNDEFSDLAKNINSMLDEITFSKKALERKAEELQVEVNSLEKFQRLTVGRELKMIELKKRIAELERRLSNG